MNYNLEGYYNESEQQVIPVEISDEDKTKLVNKIVDDIEQALEDRKPIEEEWEIAVQQYHSALEVEGRKASDSDLDIPSTRQYAEMALSRLMNPIFQRDKIFAAKPITPALHNLVPIFSDFAEHINPNKEYRIFNEQFIRQGIVYHKAVAKVGFTYEVKKIKDYSYTVKDEDGEVMSEEWGAVKNENGGYDVKDRTVAVGAFARPEVIETPNFLHPEPISDIESAPWVDHFNHIPHSLIVKRIKCGIYDETDRGDKVSEKIGEPSGERNQLIHLSLEEEQSQDISNKKLFEVHEVYFEHEGEEVIMTVERHSRVCLRLVHNWYHDYQRPFRTWSYEAVINNINGISLCCVLEPYHRALSACLNQRLDAASKAIEQYIFFTHTSGVGEYVKNNTLDSGAYAVNAVGDIRDEIMQMDLYSSSFTQMETLESNLQREMQKLAGFSDYNQGIEQIERPTATGQIALIEEGKQPLYNRMENYRSVLADLLYMQISRYKQYFPEGIEFYMQISGEAEPIRQMLQWPPEFWEEHIALETAVSSQTMNKDLRKQEMLALVDKMPQIEQGIMGMAQAALTPSPIAPIAQKLLLFHIQFVLQPWMTEFDIQGKELLDVSQEMDLGATIQQLMQQLEMAMQEAESAGMQVEELRTQVTELSGITNRVVEEFIANVKRMPTAAMGFPSGQGNEQTQGVQGTA
jgi:hypothetical protein